MCLFVVETTKVSLINLQSVSLHSQHLISSWYEEVEMSHWAELSCLELITDPQSRNKFWFWMLKGESVIHHSFTHWVDSVSTTFNVSKHRKKRLDLLCWRQPGTQTECCWSEALQTGWQTFSTAVYISISATSWEHSDTAVMDSVLQAQKNRVHHCCLDL